jgi:hypothetical protein
MLSAIDVFSEDQNGSFALTALGTTLRSDVQDSVRDRAVFYGGPDMWKVWGHLMHSVKTGGSAFEHAHKEVFFEFLSKHPEVSAPYNRYMTKTSGQHIEALLKAYDFSQFRSLVDVGGGHGATLAAILLACPQLRGVLFDLPSVVEGAKALEPIAIAERVTRVGGDMHRMIPSGSDGYLIKWVLMDRSDDDVITVLKNCRDALEEGGKIIVVDLLLPKGKLPVFPALLDVQMMLLSGSAHLRDEDEYRSLFDLAGLRVARLVPTQSPNTIIEGARP